MKRFFPLVMLLVVAMPAQSQVRRRIPNTAEPSAWVSLGIGLFNGNDVSDGNTASTWDFGRASNPLYRAAFEKAVSRTASVGLTGTYVRAPDYSLGDLWNQDNGRSFEDYHPYDGMNGDVNVMRQHFRFQDTLDGDDAACVQEAHHVDARVADRILQRGPNARLRAQVHDHVWAVTLEQRDQALGPDVHVEERELLAVAARFAEVRDAPRREVVHRDHPVLFGQQAVAEVRPDEPGAAGDQDRAQRGSPGSAPASSGVRSPASSR